MSFENVRAFYEQLTNDQAFRAEIQAVESYVCAPSSPSHKVPVH